MYIYIFIYGCVRACVYMCECVYVCYAYINMYIK